MGAQKWLLGGQNPPSPSIVYLSRSVNLPQSVVGLAVDLFEVGERCLVIVHERVVWVEGW